MAEARHLPTPSERLRHVIREHVRVMTDTLEGSPLSFEVTALSPERQDEIIAARDRYEREVRRLVEQGIRERAFRRGDAKVAAFAMLGAINWIARWYRPEGSLQADTLGAQFADHMIDGLGAAGAAEPRRAERAVPKRAARKELS